MDFTTKELDVLNETLTCLENQFDSELEAMANVFDGDEDWIDIEIQLNDDTSEQFKIERSLLSQKMSPIEIANSVN